MLNIITGKSMIAAAQNRLHRAFSASADSTHKVTLGYRGGSADAEAYWHDDLQLWGTFNRNPIGTEETRFWNAFGCDDPRTQSLLSIACEVNPPHEGLDRRIGGAFAVDTESRSVFLVHRGIIGGGRKGIGLETFWSRWDEEQATEVAEPDGRTARVAVVARLGDTALPGQLADFVRRVVAIKGGGGTTATPLGDGFTEEFSGVKHYKVNSGVSAIVNHGLVVSALNKILAQRGLEPRNDTRRDLFLNDGTKLRALFEVKTTDDLSNVYTGLGQLFINGRLTEPNCRLVLVLPKTERTAEWRTRLARLDVDLLAYTLAGKTATFDPSPSVYVGSKPRLS